MSSPSAFTSAGMRSRPIQPQIGSSDTRAMRPMRLWSARPSIKKGSSGAKNMRAASPMRGTGCASARIARRNSWSTRSLPLLLVAAQEIALELLDEHRPRLRRKRPKIFAQPFDGLTIARHNSITVVEPDR